MGRTTGRGILILEPLATAQGSYVEICLARRQAEPRGGTHCSRMYDGLSAIGQFESVDPGTCGRLAAEYNNVGLRRGLASP